MTKLPIDNLVALARTRAETLGAARAYGFLADGEHESDALTYAELDRRARRIAAELQDRSAPGTTVALAYPPGLDFVAAFFGCLYAGVIAVPMCAPHPRKGNERLAAILGDARATLMLTTLRGVRGFELATPHVPALARVTAVATDTLAAHDAPDRPVRSPASDAVAFVQYTSGSTMNPRGVPVTHANILANLAAIHRAEANDAHSRGVSWLPAYHDMGLIEAILQPLYGGFPTWLMPPAAFLQKPERWLRAISRYRATVSGGPNFAYDLCVRRCETAAVADLALDCWRVAYCGAEPVRAATLDAFASRFAACGFARAALRPVYGLAEATLLVTASAQDAPGPRIVYADKRRLEDGRFEPAQPASTHAQPLVSCGCPDAVTRVAIADPQADGLLPEDAVGEVLVAGPGVTRGYLGASGDAPDGADDRGTRTRDTRWLRTGDLGFIHAGELYLCGRRKDLIVMRGRKLHPQDVEHTILTHAGEPPIEAVAAFAIDDEHAEQLVVCAELARARHAASGVEHGRTLAAAADRLRVAVYRAHDVSIACFAFVTAGALPRTTSGKLMRYRARAQFIAATLPVIARFDTPAGAVDGRSA